MMQAMGQSANLCCVKCNSILDRATFQGLEVDLAPSAAGSGSTAARSPTPPKLPEKELARLRNLLRGSRGHPRCRPRTRRPAPPAKGSLAEVLLGTVHVDYCGTCHGIFLDRGELQQAIDAVRARERDTTPDQLLVPWKGEGLQMSLRHLRSWQGATRANTRRI